MGIGSILGNMLKNVSWDKLAGAAMEYAPQLYRQALERRASAEDSTESAAQTELHARINRLEKLLMEQETVIREQAEKTSLLERTCTSLENRLLVFRIASGALLLIVLILLFLLLKPA